MILSHWPQGSTTNGEIPMTHLLRLY